MNFIKYARESWKPILLIMGLIVFVLLISPLLVYLNKENNKIPVIDESHNKKNAGKTQSDAGAKGEYDVLPKPAAQQEMNISVPSQSAEKEKRTTEANAVELSAHQLNPEEENTIPITREISSDIDTVKQDLNSEQVQTNIEQEPSNESKDHLNMSINQASQQDKVETKSEDANSLEPIQDTSKTISAAKIELEIDRLLREHDISGSPPLRISKGTAQVLHQIKDMFAQISVSDSETDSLKQTRVLVDKWLSASNQSPSIMLSKIPQNTAFVVYLDIKSLRKWTVLSDLINNWFTSDELIGTSSKIKNIANQLSIKPMGLVNQICIWNPGPDHEKVCFSVQTNSPWPEVSDAISQIYTINHRSQNSLTIGEDSIHCFSDGIITCGDRRVLQEIIEDNSDSDIDLTNETTLLWDYIRYTDEIYPVWCVMVDQYSQSYTKLLDLIGIKKTDNVKALRINIDMAGNQLNLDLVLFLSEIADSQAVTSRVQIALDQLRKKKEDSLNLKDLLIKELTENVIIRPNDLTVKCSVRIPIEKLTQVFKRT